MVMMVIMWVVMVCGRRLRWGCSMEEARTLKGAQGSRLFVCLVAMVVMARGILAYDNCIDWVEHTDGDGGGNAENDGRYVLIVRLGHH